MTWPLEKASVSHRLTFTSLSVRSGGPRLTLAGWWATRISATVRFYTATQPCSTRYGACVCKNVRMWNECECFPAFDLWTAPANTQLPAVVVCCVLTLMLNWCPCCGILHSSLISHSFLEGMNARKNDSLKQKSWITGSVWLCWAFDLLLLFVSFCTGNRAALIVLN